MGSKVLNLKIFYVVFIALLAVEDYHAYMFGLGAGELLVITIVIVLLFGAKKLPGLGEAFGKSITGFKKGLKEGQDGQDGEGSQSAAKVEGAKNSTENDNSNS